MTTSLLFDEWLKAVQGILGECINHDHEQVGRCVFCKTCGRRLYQGMKFTEEELAELREAMEGI